MATVEQQIIMAVHKLDETQQQSVLAYIYQLETPSLSAVELMRLPPDERDRLVKAAFEAAANEDFEIFEAYTEEPIDDIS